LELKLCPILFVSLVGLKGLGEFILGGEKNKGIVMISASTLIGRLRIWI